MCGGAPTRGDAARGKQVFGAVGNAVQHPPILARGDLLVCLSRLLQGELFGDLCHRAQGSAARAQRLQRCLRQLHRRDFARAQQPRLFGEREKKHLVAHRRALRTGRGWKTNAGSDPSGKG